MKNISPEQSSLVAEFDMYRARGYKGFCRANIIGYETLVLENAQLPTEQIAALVLDYKSSGAEDLTVIEGGGVILRDRRVILAMQQLNGDGVDVYGTKQHLLRIACEL